MIRTLPIILITALLSACASHPSQNLQIPEGFTRCEDPRPQICTMHFAPACGIDSDGNRQDFSNPCGGCSAPNIIAVAGKSCESLTAHSQEQALAQNDPWHKAKLEGVSYRAVGNEPGWHLEIKKEDSIKLTTDYGSTVLTSQYLPPTVDSAKQQAQYTTDDNQFIINISGISCTDSMSGETFESSVTVIMEDGQKLKGCGKALH